VAGRQPPVEQDGPDADDDGDQDEDDDPPRERQQVRGYECDGPEQKPGTNASAISNMPPMTSISKPIQPSININQDHYVA
jgi:hypothetical protein